VKIPADLLPLFVWRFSCS